MRIRKRIMAILLTAVMLLTNTLPVAAAGETVDPIPESKPTATLTVETVGEGTVHTVTSKETLQKGIIELQKVDSETKKAEPQGSASLKGAIYDIFLKSAYQPGDDVNAKSYQQSITTDETGFAKSKELLLDTYYVIERTPSNGYLVDPEIYEVSLTPKNTTDRVFTEKVTSKEEIIRGNVEIIKLKENEDNENDTLQGLEGVEFTFTSDTTGKVVKKIVTDKNGFATTVDKDNPRGGLLFDTYTVTETKCPEGLKPIEPFKVTIKEEGVTLKGIYKEDKIIVSPVSVVKIDASTGKVIPVANTEFRLLDENKKPITMTTHYPNKVEHTTFKTDENGQFTFPDKLKYGTYYLEELKAPHGYLKGQLLEFKVTSGANWGNPLIVKYEDENAMGKITIQKTDKENKDPISGAVFEVKAAKDIVTPDGTIRATKGEVVDTLTTVNGTATTKPLFLGNYEVVEIKSAPGYVLNKKAYQVELKYKDQNTAIVTESVAIKNKPTEIELLKVDDETEEPMEGVTFRIWQKPTADQGNQPVFDQEFTTDEKEIINVKRLHPGTYFIQEIKTLPGYVLNDKIMELTIDEDGFIDGEEKAEIILGNNFTKVDLSKHDLTTGKEIEGGKYQVLDPDGKVVDEWTGTKEPHRITRLEIGKTYLFREIVAPYGYLLTLDVEFTVENTGKVQKVEMFDELAMGTITVQKTDMETKDPISGAVFEVKAEEDIVTPDGTLRVKKGEVVDFRTIEEIKKEYKEIPDRDQTFPGRGGTIISRYQDKLYIDDTICNNLIIGMTRSGKDEFYVFPTIDNYSRAEEKTSLLVLDPKTDSYRSSKEILEKRGYDVYFLNLDQPVYSMGYNPLELIKIYYKKGCYDDAEMLSDAFAYSIYTPDDSNLSGNEKFFAESAASLLSGMVLSLTKDCLDQDAKENEQRVKEFYKKQEKFRSLDASQQEIARTVYYEMLEKGRDPITDRNLLFLPDELDVTEVEQKHTHEQCITMYSILNMVIQLSEEKLENSEDTMLDEYFRIRPALDAGKMRYSSAMVAGDRTKGSILSTLINGLNVFKNRAIAKMTAESTLNFDDIGFGDRPVAVFLGIPDYDRSKWFLATVFIRQAYYYLAQKCSRMNGECKRHVKFICNEFGNMPPIDDMKSVVTVCCGRNISFDMYVQSYAQLAECYGEKTQETIEGNCGNTIYILSSSKETSEKVSNLIGEHTVLMVQRSGKRFSLSKNYSETPERVPLLYPEQLRRLKEGECVIIPAIHRKDLKGNDIKEDPIFNSVKTKTRLKYRYQYLSKSFPNPKMIQLEDVNGFNCDHINPDERVWDPKLSFQLRKQTGEKEAVFSDLSKGNQEQIKKLLKKEMGKDYNNEMFQRDVPLRKILMAIQMYPINAYVKKSIMDMLLLVQKRQEE